MRVTLLDNGLWSKGEHSFAIDRALKSTLEKAGIEVAIYSFQGVATAICEELGCRPHFARNMYEYESVYVFRIDLLARQLLAALKGTKIHIPSARRTARVLNESFEADLERLPHEVWAAGNIVLLPGLMQNQLLGLARFLSSREIQAKVVCHLMFEPSWTSWGQPSSIGEGIYRKAFSLLSNQIGKRVFFTTENRFMSNLYAADFHIATGILPVPLLGTERGEHIHEKIQIGFFGYSKIEKGFHLLAEAISICLSKRDDLQFKIQINHDGDNAVAAAEHELRKNPTLILFEGVLSAEEFAVETSLVDIMLVPYHPDLFGYRGSGIFTESITSGRPIVASKRTWAGLSVDMGQAIGETFDPYTSECLAAAILRLCSELKEKQAEAMAKASSFKNANSIETYAKNLFLITGLESPVNMFPPFTQRTRPR